MAIDMRDSRIELYRCLCMFGVVLLHSLTQGGYADAHRGLDNLMTPSVVGFVFISGWFGIRFSWKGVRKILSIGAWCWVVIAMLNWNFRSSYGIGGFWWFLWMYLALMTLAPLVESILVENDRGGAFRKVMPFLVAIFGWSYAATKIPGLKEWVPCVDGFSPFGVLTFLGVYVAARYLSRVDVEKWRVRWLVLAALVSGAACWMGFYHYNSPFALIFAGSIFLLIKKAKLPAIVQHNTSALKEIVLWLGPSMFSVYLLHTNSAGFAFLRRMEDWMVAQGWNYYAMSFTVAISIFVGCIVLDLPRRIVEWGFKTGSAYAKATVDKLTRFTGLKR